VARENNVIVLSDEIYALLTFKEHKHHSIAEYYPEGTLVTGGLSKDRSAGGFRVGVMILPSEEPDLLDSMLTIASNTWSCVASPIQHAAIEAYTPNQDITDYIRDCTAISEVITKHCHQLLQDSEIRCLAPAGAFYLFPDWDNYREKMERKGIQTSMDLSEALLRDWSVATLPGSDFGMTPEDLCIRLATVDYDGETALREYRENRQEAQEFPESLAKRVAPRLVDGILRLGLFTDSFR